MRDIKRNEQTIYYANQTSVETFDEDGNPDKDYETPKEYKISVSAGKGEVNNQGFGADLKYDKEMIKHDMGCEINEFSRLWVDGQAPDKKHNYIVKGVAKSLNCIRYAIERVDIS